MRIATHRTHFLVFSSLFAVLMATAPAAHAFTCPPKGPVATGSRVNVVYDPGDSSMKACISGSWVTMAGGGSPGGIDTLSDVTITSATLNDALVFNGTNWVNSPITVSESDPQVGAMTANNWCVANAGGTAIVCNQSAPGGGGSSSGTAGYVQLSGGSGAFASSSTAAGNQLFWDTTNHRLGIGTTTPLDRLNVRSGTNVNLIVGPQFQVSGATQIAALNDANTALIPLEIRATQATVMGGSVGIGTTTPDTSALLDVSSTTKGILLPRLTTTQVTAVATPADGLIVYDVDTDTLKLRANGAWASLGAGGSGSPGGANTQIQFNDSGALGGDADFVWNKTTNQLTVTGNISATSTTATSVVSANTSLNGGVAQLYLNNTGTGGTNWSINAGNTTTGGGLGANLGIAEGSNYRMVIAQGGNVGIGVTAPMTLLHVKGGEAGIFLEETTGGADNEAYLVHFNNVFQIQNRPSNNSSSVVPYAFDIRAPVNTISTLSNGNVGIGIAVPVAKLHVSGGPTWTTNGWQKTISIQDGSAIEFGRGATTKFGQGESGNILYNWYTTANTNESAANYYLQVGSTGNISIGGGAPTASKLHVDNNVSGAAIRGNNTGANYGLYGTSAGTYGILGQTSSTSHGGVLGYSADSLNYGILGHANVYGLYAVGQYGARGDGTTYGGYFVASVNHGLYAQGASASMIGAYSYNAGSGCYEYAAYSSYGTYTNCNAYIAGTLFYGGLSPISDGRLKENIKAVPPALDTLLKLKPVTYNWKKDTDQASANPGSHYGFIAQDVEKVLPELINRTSFAQPANIAPISTKDPKTGKAIPSKAQNREKLNQKLGEVLSVEYLELVPLAVKAIQELKAENDELKARLDALEKAQKAE